MTEDEMRQMFRDALPAVMKTAVRLLKSDDPGIRADAARMIRTIAIAHGIMPAPGTPLH